MTAGLSLALASLAWAATWAATPACVKPCKADTASCVRVRCTGLRAGARRGCVETCRGIGGCAAIRTLAYVVTECHADARDNTTARQELRVRRGNCAPVTVWSTTLPEPFADPVIRLCRRFGDGRDGDPARFGGVVSRLAVSPDGSLVVFEVTNDFLPFVKVLAPEEEGMFAVRADGRGLRPLGPQSRVAPYKLYPIPGPFGVGVNHLSSALVFSADGRAVALLDRLPGPEDPIQIVTVEVATGERFQVTRLPDADDSTFDPSHVDTFSPRFVANDTISFVSYANPEGLNPEGELAVFLVRIDGRRLRRIRRPEAIGDAEVVPEFSVTGPGTNVLTLVRPGVPQNPGRFSTVREAFLLDGKNLLQLTNFHRTDTSGRFLGRDGHGRRVFVTASADPFGENPFDNCQLFSVDPFGAGLRQLTRFDEGQPSIAGCQTNAPPGCALFAVVQDPVTGILIMNSQCDPFGMNPYGGQLFAIRPDGSGLRQLTHTRGRVVGGDGSVTVELPGPFGYSESVR